MGIGEGVRDNDGAGKGRCVRVYGNNLNVYRSKPEVANNMKIGILSMQRIINYGSFWQANMLKNFFESQGNMVEFIDIIPGRRLYTFSQNNKSSIGKMDRVLRKIMSIRRKKIIREAQKKALGCGDDHNYSDDYDCIIIGSDEVFNFAQPASWGFTPQLHGAIHNENVNSYAASFGASTYEDVEKYGIRDELVNAFSNLKHISVRDENSYSIISQLLPNQKIYRHLDPVLVGDLPNYERKEVKKKYIIIYAYDSRFNDEKYIKAIRQFANKRKLKIYAAFGYQEWVDKNIVVDPFELLQYFANAEYIITDTFHGTIFSVRCHKKFVTVIREGIRGNSQKLSSLLEDLNLKNRLLTNDADIEKILTAEIDYQVVENILQSERQRTEEYLKMCLDEAAITK